VPHGVVGRAREDLEAPVGVLRDAAAHLEAVAAAAAGAAAGPRAQLVERAVEHVAVDAADAADAGVVGVLPELPVAPRVGQVRAARPVVGDPQRIAGEVGIAEVVAPEEIGGVDERHAAGARLHAIEERVQPRDHRRCRHVVGDLDVGHRRQIAGGEPALRVYLVHEVIALRRAVGAGAEEVIGAAQDAGVAHARPVVRERAVDEAGAFGGLGEGEDAPRGLDRAPADARALIARDVDAVDHLPVVAAPGQAGGGLVGAAVDAARAAGDREPRENGSEQAIGWAHATSALLATGQRATRAGRALRSPRAANDRSMFAGRTPARVCRDVRLW
jgi:hypothetical protein